MRTDTTYIYNKVCSAALMMLCCVALFSCTKVDLCEEPQHIHRENIKLIYHWPEDVTEEQRPDSMFALINRAVTTHHIGYVTDTVNSDGGRYQFGGMYEDNVDRHPLMAKVGSYRVFAFNYDIVKSHERYRFENFDQFANNEGDNTIDVNDLYISYVPHERTDSCVLPDSIDSIDWIDTNPYSKYIAANMRPLYRAVNDYDEKAQSYTFSVKEQGETKVLLYPQKATQDITITFPIYLEYTDEDTVSAESIIAEISGIPHRMNFNSGELYVDTTYKVLFKMELDTLNAKETKLEVNKDTKDSLTFNEVQCTSTISVTGLLANEGPEFATGAGIMQLCAHLSTKGGKKAKVMAKVNMYNTINDANLIIKDEEGRIMQNSKEIYPELPYNNTLRVEGNLLMVTHDLVLKTVGDGEGTDTWQGDKDGDGEIDDDHKLDIEM